MANGPVRVGHPIEVLSLVRTACIVHSPAFSAVDGGRRALGNKIHLFVHEEIQIAQKKDKGSAKDHFFNEPMLPHLVGRAPDPGLPVSGSSDPGLPVSGSSDPGLPGWGGDGSWDTGRRAADPRSPDRRRPDPGARARGGSIPRHVQADRRISRDAFLAPTIRFPRGRHAPRD